MDFEMYWGVHGLVPWPAYRQNILGVRQAIPEILRLFCEFGIHATWATVGFLMFETKKSLLHGLPRQRPAYVNSRVDNYAHVPEIGPDESSDPIHFAASLVDLINRQPGQEIATHTFSHYYCMEQGQDAECFRSDLEAARAAAEKRGVVLKSIVFPCNQVREDYLPICQSAGITAYRGTQRGFACQPTDHAGQKSRPRRALRLLDSYFNLAGSTTYCPERAGAGRMTNVQASRYLRPYMKPLALLEPLRLRRIRCEMTHAARTAEVYHLWWHPHDFGLYQAENLNFLRRTLEHFRALQGTYRMESRNMAEMTAIPGGP
jgi:hypothetical protein